VPAGYPWSVVQGSWSGAKLNLDDPSTGYKCDVQGWITRDAAARIFENANLDLEESFAQSSTSDFQPINLEFEVSVSIDNTIKRDKSKNLIAKITGSENPEEAIIYSAHWDHLGVGQAVNGDSIFNGAVDNASGVAIILALAEAFSQQPPPKRTIVFLAVTGEEQGLLGSAYYASNPIFEPTKTVANLNIDAIAALGRMKDLTVIGYGQSELDDLAEIIATKQGRYIYPDPHSGKGYFFRSDHFNFAKIGIPAFYASGSYEGEFGGVDRIKKESEAYESTRYHRQADEYDAASWRFGGILQDAELYYELGLQLANSDQWPAWKDGSEFKAVREK
jgi:Zn-dependent M28 family amino/carboxypeptidase